MEQRQDYRLSRPATVVVELPGAGEEGRGLWVACRALDLSGGGMQIQLDRPLINGQILRLRFHPDYQAAPIEVLAEVRWQQQRGAITRAGLNLYLAEQTDIQHWKEFVAQSFA